MGSRCRAVDWTAYPLIAGLVVLLAIAVPAAAAAAVLATVAVALIGRSAGGRDG